MKRELSLKFLFGFVTIFIVVIFLALMYMSISQVSKIRKLQDLYTGVHDSYILWKEAQHAQHDFLINYKNDVIFFQTKQNKFIKRSQIKIAQLENNIDSMINILGDIFPEYTTELKELKANSRQTEKVFEEVVDNLFLRGSEKTGLVGDCFINYNTSLGYVSSDRRLLYYSGRMYTRFLEYLNQPANSHYRDFINVYFQLNSYLNNKKIRQDTANLDTSTIISLNSLDNVEFVNHINSFKNNFSKLVSIDNKIFMNPNNNLLLKWKDLNKPTDIKWTNLYDNIEKGFFTKIKKQHIKLLVYAAFMLILILLVLTIFPIFFVKRLKEINAIITPLASGGLPDEIDTHIPIKELKNIFSKVNYFIASLRKTSEFASEISKGNFDYDYQPLSNQDILGNSLIALRDNLQKAKEEEAKRLEEDKIVRWTNEGIAKFSDILRESAKDISELSVRVLKELVHYIEANQGGLFVVNENEKENKKYLELVASYAYSKERKRKKQIYFGEGLVGTCAVEKNIIYMTEIPEDYISISSGLGGANPKSLLIVPLLFEENILGVIEMASFEEIPKYKIDFVERIAESIASTISIAKINERTAKLLEISQKEAEQRALKEEELRQNLEELKSTQERAAQRERELNQLFELINKVAFIIELDINGQIVKIPDRLSEFFDLQPSEIIGRHLSEFDYNKNSELAKPEFWQSLLEGNEKVHLHKYIAADKVFWIQDYIVPSLDAYGNVEKFVCILFDNTEQVELQESAKKFAEELKEREKEIVEKVKELEKTKKEVDLLVQELTGTITGVDSILLRAEYTPEGILTDANDLHQQVLGYKKSYMIGKSILEFVPKEEHEEFMKFWKKIADGHFETLTVKRENKATSEDIWLVNHYVPVKDREGNVIKILYLALDITKQKENEEKVNNLLNEAESRQKRLDEILAGIDRTLLRAVYEKDGTLVEANELHQQVLGYDIEEMKGKSILEFLEEKDRSDFQKFWEEIAKGNAKQLTVKRLNKSTGEEIWLENHYNPIFDLQGNVVRILYLAIDITNQMKAEEDIKHLLEETEKRQKLLDDVLGGIDRTLLRAVYEKDGTLINANKLHQQVLGYDIEEMKGKSILEFINDEEKENFKKFWEEVAAGNPKQLIVKRLNKSTGEEIWLKNYYNPLFDLVGNVDKILYLAIDITEQKQAEEIFRRDEELFKIFFDRTNDAIQWLKNGVYIDCNSATLDMFGYDTKEEFLNISPAEYSPEFQPDGRRSDEKANEMIQIAIEKGFNTFEWVHKRKNGETFPADVTLISYHSLKDIYVYALVKDLTKEDKQMKTIREFRQKLEEMDVELERKHAEIFYLKKEIEKLKNKK